MFSSRRSVPFRFRAPDRTGWRGRKRPPREQSKTRFFDPTFQVEDGQESMARHLFDRSIPACVAYRAIVFHCGPNAPGKPVVTFRFLDRALIRQALDRPIGLNSVSARQLILIYGSTKNETTIITVANPKTASAVFRFPIPKSAMATVTPVNDSASRVANTA